MEELIGFVSGNDGRVRILGILGSQGAMDEKSIARRARMVPLTTAKILGELLEKGLVESNGGAFSLTKLGNDVENVMKGLR